MRTRLAAALACAVIALNACREATGPRPVMLQQVRGDSQTGLPGDTLPVPLTVKATSASGAPLGGVTVAWTVTEGSRFEYADSVTNPDGTAAARVILGPLPGPVVVTAGATGGGGGASGTFIAEFQVLIVDPCRTATALALGQAASGVFTGKDCRFFDGSRLDVWTLTLDQPQRVDIVMNSAAVNAYLILEDSAQSLAYDNDAGPGTDAVLRTLLPARRFFVIANTLQSGEFGAYTLLTAVAPPDVGECEEVWVVRPFTAAQTLPAAPCRGVAADSAPILADQLPVYVVAGPLTAEITAAGFAAAVRIYADGAVMAEGVAAAPGQTARAVFDVPRGARGKVFVQFSAADGGNAGAAYSMTVR